MSAERIITRIQQDAEAEAAAILAAAREKAAALTAEAEAASAQKVEEIRAEAATRGADAARRIALLASLEERKNSLAARRAVIDRAFEEAYAALCALPQERFEALVTALVLENAGTGEEEVQVAKEDRAAYEAVLPKVNAALVAAGKKGGLRLCSEPARFAGGFALIGTTCDVNCSYEALLRAAREREERAVAALLFETEG